MEKTDFTKCFPIIIPPYIMPKTPVLVQCGDEVITEAIEHSQRPYRVIVTKKGLIIPEWMWNPKNGIVFRTFWEQIKKDYFEKGKVVKYFLQGTRATYNLLRDGTFLVPYADQPLSVTVNEMTYTFDDVFPHAKYVIQARTEIMKTQESKFDNIGLGWRKIVPLPDGREIDLTVTLLVTPDEREGKWEIIISNPENGEKYDFTTSVDTEKYTIKIKIP